MPIDLYPSVAKVKRNGVYQNLPGFGMESTDNEAQAMIANAETSTSAQYAHPDGSYFRLNGVLYQADENIRVNDTIAVGINCHVAVLGNDVEENTTAIKENAKNISDLKSSTTNDFSSVVGNNNLMDFANWIDGAYINASGSITSGADFHYTEEIPLKNQSLILKFISDHGSTTSAVRIHGYKNNSWVRQLAQVNIGTTGTPSGTFNVSDIDAIRVSARKDVPVSSMSIVDISAVSQINNLEDAEYIKQPIIRLWEVGAINIGTGLDVSNSTRLRTSILPEEIKSIIVPDGYWLSFRVYDGSTYKGAFNGNSYVVDSGTEWFKTGTINIKSLPNYSYRLVIRRADNGSITLSEANNIVFVRTTQSKEIHIGAGYTYTTLRSGIEEAIKHIGAKVIVHDGEYDLCTEFATEISANETDVLFGIKLENDVSVYFLPSTHVKALYDGSESNIIKCFQPFYAGTKGGYTIEGLDILASSTRYCIHDENGQGNFPRKVLIKNSNFSFSNRVDGDLTDYPQCIGGGLGRTDDITIQNCCFENTSFTVSAVPLISYHNAFSIADAESRITIANCYLAATGKIKFGYAGSSEYISRANVNNCKMGNAITVQAENASATVVNIALIEYNNTVDNE